MADTYHMMAPRIFASLAEVGSFAAWLATNYEAWVEDDHHDERRDPIAIVHEELCQHPSNHVAELSERFYRNPNSSGIIWIDDEGAGVEITKEFAGVWEWYLLDADEIAHLGRIGVKCSACGTVTNYVIGCPDGQEICPDCFENGVG
jgi:hypothetical protein